MTTPTTSTPTTTIVCVDDDALIASGIARALRKDKYHALATTEPEEALEWCLEHDVAVLLADYNMPGMTGVELAERVREHRPSTVRVLLTGNIDTDTTIASINQGEIFRFVAKPFDRLVLASVVQQAVARHRELAAVALEREQASHRQRFRAEIEARFPTLTHPARAHDGAYLVQRASTDTIERIGLRALRARRSLARVSALARVGTPRYDWVLAMRRVMRFKRRSARLRRRIILRSILFIAFS
jgi:response regulator RpfG family c-di-GMP phosphodiesterase